jgi:hypothetical protein
MIWNALPVVPETPARFLVFSKYGIEVALFYPPCYWVTPGGCPVTATHWAAMPDAP